MDSTINFLPGRSIVIFMPNGEQHKGRFAVTELSEITASHHEKTFSSSQGYPLDREGKNINDRNYSDDQQAQAEVKIVAQHLNPERILSTARDESGSPVITQTGIVISGNNRTMSLKLAASDFPENYEHYKKVLHEELPAFGIETKDFDARNFSQPILVRIDYDITDPTTADLSKFNKDTKKTERPIDIALKLRKMLAESDRCTSVISDIVKNYETFSEFRANFNDEKRLRDTLLECNIMVRQEMNRYWYERGFTDEGMDLLENMLSGIILEPDALRAGIESGVKQMRNILIVSLPVLIKNKTMPRQYSLIPVINKAIILEAKIQASGLIRTDYLAQEKLFEEKPDIDTVYMNALLHLGRNKFKDAIERYNNSADAALMGNMFGDAPQPDQMFDVFIKRSVPETEAKVIEKYFGTITPPHNIDDEPVPAVPDPKTLSEKVRIFMQMLQGPEMAMEKGGNLNGRAKNMSVEDIATLHKVPVKQIRAQLEKGMNVELEHTSDLTIAKQIAKDHLVESPVYYDKLHEMEKSFAGGGKAKLGKNILLAPNGKPSRLTPQQYQLVRTPEFKTWFGDWENDPQNASKIVDENGEPLIVYHGTQNEFHTFNTNSELGAHFGNKKQAEYILRRKRGNFYYRYDQALPENTRLVSCFLNIKKPLRLSDLGTWSDPPHTMAVLLTDEVISREEYNSIPRDSSNEEVKKLLKDKGYDGIVYLNKHEGLTGGFRKVPSGDSYIAFDANQIKLADGSNTTFDASNPDIRFAKGGLLAPNGKPSRLTPQQYQLVRTPEFKTWFGDWENDPQNASKVVDKNGEPMVVYHGYKYSEDEEEEKKEFYAFGGNRAVGWFAEDKGYAGTYAESEKQIYAVFLNIKNPLIFDDKEIDTDDEMTNEEFEKFIGFKLNRNSLEDHSKVKNTEKFFVYEFLDSSITTFQDQLYDKNYDGLFITEKGFPTWMILYPDQAKLADGRNTTFDAKNPDIRFAQGGSIENEIEQEKQNIDAAIAAALRSEDHYFEGVSLSQLKEDKVLLETDPRKYFLQQSGRMFKQSIDSRLSEQDRQLALRLGQEYNRVFNMLMQRQVNSSIIKNEAGGEACGVCEHDNVAVSLAHGGIVKGRRHSEGGEKFNLDGQGPRVELEAGEPVVPEQLLNDNRQYTLTGTNRQVLNKIMGMAGVSLNDKVTQVKSGDVVICRLSANDDAPRKYTGTLRQIVSAVNTSSGQCNMVEPGAKVQELQPA